MTAAVIASTAKRLAVLLVLLAACVVPSAASAAPGVLDPSFDPSGAPPGTAVVASPAAGTAVAVLSDGKIVTAGTDENADEFEVARYNADGTLDTTFDPGGPEPGIVTDTVAGLPAAATSLAVAPGGKLVVAGCGEGGDGDQEFAVAVYDSDGTPDTSFDPGGAQPGTVVTPVGSGGGGQGSGGWHLACAFGVVVQPDGRIVAAGIASANHTNSFALVRYDPDGSLDTSFGAAGAEPGIVLTQVGVGTPFNDQYGGVVLGADGKLTVAGTASSAITDGATTDGFALARYNPDGTLDTSFDAGGPQPGTVITEIADGGEVAHALVVQGDGNFVVAGTAIDAGGHPDFALARYDADGSLDTTFDAAGAQPGTVVTPIGVKSLADGLALQADGKLVAAGDAFDAGDENFALARYNANGTLDASFDAAGSQPGTVETPLGDDGLAAAAGVAIGGDDTAVVTGFADFGPDFDDGFVLARYLLDPLVQSITFPAVGPLHVGPATVTLSATASSGLPVTYRVLSGPCHVSAATLSVSGVGSCQVAADQAGAGHYAAAPEVMQTIAVNADAATTCKVTLTVTGPPTASQQVTVQNTASGLSAITNIKITNGTVAFPAITPGTTGPVVVTATKTNQSLKTVWSFDATDAAGNVTHCS
jgi:uncharacterized delta-60 repeat protein